MTAALASPQARRIGKPIMLTLGEIREQRDTIERTFGTRESLEDKRDIIGLTLDERIALRNLEDLDYLEGC
ncbi:hypothetical protein [Bifidobacterium catenulatum]|uniref:hypothetical protein n=1 Tax=Bifidobacterium catenulatum TaxID=1686 RepID=UPI0026EAD457|nr:hypothetical protein [Bifidobacterium catenulatum]